MLACQATNKKPNKKHECTLYVHLCVCLCMEFIAMSCKQLKLAHDKNLMAEGFSPTGSSPTETMVVIAKLST